MSGFACPRCHSELDEDAEGTVVCEECGQTVALPEKSHPISAVPRPQATRFYVGSGDDWWDRNWGWVFVAALGLVVLAFLFGNDLHR